MQFNVVDRQTLLDAQEHPEKYKHLVVRVAGYSALFTTLSRSLQDDIIVVQNRLLIQMFLKEVKVTGRGCMDNRIRKEKHGLFGYKGQSV